MASEPLAMETLILGGSNIWQMSFHPEEAQFTAITSDLKKTVLSYKNVVRTILKLEQLLQVLFQTCC